MNNSPFNSSAINGPSPWGEDSVPSISDYLENKIIDFLFRAEPYVPVTNLYLALFTTPTTDAGEGTEVVGSGYHRVLIEGGFSTTQGPNTTGISNGVGGQISNNAQIQFPIPLGDWGVVTHMAIYDSLTDGNMLVHGPLTYSKQLGLGDSGLVFPISAIRLTLA